MEFSPAGSWTAPWLVLVVVLAVLALACVAALLVLRRRTAGRPGARNAEPLSGYREDDLPGFLEFPPGSAGHSAPPAAGWPSLAAVTPRCPGVPAGLPAGTGRKRTGVALGVAALTALLIVAVLAFAPRPGEPDRTGGHDREAVDVAPAPGGSAAGELADVTVRPGRKGGGARLTFGGLVLEQRAVGITATYPTVEVSWNRDQGVAHVRLPTFNCLAASAPDDPVAAGCVASVPEYADLATPDLAVAVDDGAVVLSGRFPTYVRPNGSPPVWTGRVYEFRVRAAPVDGESEEGWVRAEGEIRLGPDQARTLDLPEVTVLLRD